jgi:hypothetical protein
MIWTIAMVMNRLMGWLRRTGAQCKRTGSPPAPAAANLARRRGLPLR